MNEIMMMGDVWMYLDSSNQVAFARVTTITKFAKIRSDMIVSDLVHLVYLVHLVHHVLRSWISIGILGLVSTFWDQRQLRMISV